MLTTCWRFAMVRIFDRGPGWIQGLTPFVGQLFCKKPFIITISFSSALSKLPARPQKVHEKISGGVQILVASSNRFNITLSEWGSNQKVRHWFRVKCIFKIRCRWFFTIFFILENLEKEKPRISCRIWFRGIVRTHWYSGIDSRRVKLKVDED